MSGASTSAPALEEEKKMMTLILQSSEGIDMEIDEDVAFQSNLLKAMVSNLGIENSESPLLKEPLKLTKISAETLKKLLDWCTKHRGEVYLPKEEHEDPRITLTSDDEEWLNVLSEQLWVLLLGADFLDIPSIIAIITQKVANMADGKSVQEIRDLYSLENDFTPEEEEEYRRRYGWAEA